MEWLIFIFYLHSYYLQLKNDAHWEHSDDLRFLYLLPIRNRETCSLSRIDLTCFLLFAWDIISSIFQSSLAIGILCTFTRTSLSKFSMIALRTLKSISSQSPSLMVDFWTLLEHHHHCLVFPSRPCVTELNKPKLIIPSNFYTSNFTKLIRFNVNTIHKHCSMFQEYTIHKYCSPWRGRLNYAKTLYHAKKFKKLWNLIPLLRTKPYNFTIGISWTITKRLKKISK